MKTLEYWVLRIADSDWTWVGFNWLRPDRRQRLGFLYLLFSSMLLGFPGVVAGAGLIYLFSGSVEAHVWASLFIFVTMIELPLHLLLAHFWNRRADALMGGASTA